MPPSPDPPIHRRPNESCLEPFREQIAERRRLLWPYRRLAEWLAEEHQLTIDWSTIRNFCDVRSIRKGDGRSKASRARAPRKAVQESKADDFNFNTDGPIEIYR